MAQLGSGTESEYPGVVDTRQVYRNGTNPAPDSDTRVDAEFLNGSLSAIIAIENALGAGIQGTYSSLAARLDALLPAPAGIPNVVFFLNTDTVTIPVAQHELDTSALLIQLYDNATPHAAIQPQAITVHPATFEVEITFALPQSGMAVLGMAPPQYIEAFTNQTTLTIPGATHALGTGRLLWQLYDASTPAQVIQPGMLTVHPTTFAVVVSFAVPQSGTLVLNAGAPRYVQPFTNQTTVTVLGAVHGLGSPHLLWGLYDTGTPAAAIQPSTLTVHPTTHDVVVSFAVPQSGELILASVDTAAALLLAQLGLTRLQPKAIAIADTGTLVLTLRQMLERLMRLETAYAALQAATLSSQEGP